MLGTTDGCAAVRMTVVVIVMTLVRVRVVRVAVMTVVPVVIGRVDVYSVVDLDEFVGIVVMVGVVRSEVLKL